MRQSYPLSFLWEPSFMLKSMGSGGVVAHNILGLLVLVLGLKGLGSGQLRNRTSGSSGALSLVPCFAQ